MHSLIYLFAAYSATWIILLLYLVSLWKKQERIEKGLHKLQEHYRLHS